MINSAIEPQFACNLSLVKL